MSFTSGDYLIIIIIIFGPGVIGLFLMFNNKDKILRVAIGIGLILISALLFLGFKITSNPVLPDKCIFYNESFSCKEFKILDDNGLGQGALTFKISVEEVNLANFELTATEPYNSESSACKTMPIGEMVLVECIFNQKFQPGQKMRFDIKGTYVEGNVTVTFIGLIFGKVEFLTN